MFQAYKNNDFKYIIRKIDELISKREFIKCKLDMELIFMAACKDKNEKILKLVIDTNITILLSMKGKYTPFTYNICELMIDNNIFSMVEYATERYYAENLNVINILRALCLKNKHEIFVKLWNYHDNTNTKNICVYMYKYACIGDNLETVKWMEEKYNKKNLNIDLSELCMNSSIKILEYKWKLSHFDKNTYIWLINMTLLYCNVDTFIWLMSKSKINIYEGNEVANSISKVFDDLCKKNKYSMIKAIIDNKIIHPSFIDHGFINACSNNDKKMVSLFMENKHEWNEKTSYRALNKAVINNNIEIIKMLKNYNIFKNINDDIKMITHIYTQSEYISEINVETIKCLFEICKELDIYVNINTRSHTLGYTDANTNKGLELIKLGFPIYNSDNTYNVICRPFNQNIVKTILLYSFTHYSHVHPYKNCLCHQLKKCREDVIESLTKSKIKTLLPNVLIRIIINYM